ncbi:MAG: UDP-glucose--hexose-1-phosphate uridylyltransferase [Cyclobacteriaceae bacterium]|nr:UDP-glucose--hexose-1-phosphate uridylyltransferase [Cyclobacteriaceae bacterium HetDA_MAG_MS6]
MFDYREHSHRRFNLLTGEWVQVSPHRSKRPWQGQEENANEERRPSYDEKCYLCPGNKRANGELNPDYGSTYSFVNDFGALQSDVPDGDFEQGFFRAKRERGICKVVCFSPRHDLTIPELSNDEIKGVIDLWVRECQQLALIPYVNHIQIFENKGSVMGCSNPHPHGQIWAQETVPVEPDKKQTRQSLYYLKNKRSLIADYLEKELESGERIVFENEHFVTLVPFWAIWPYETMIVPKRWMRRITELTEEERFAFADAYRRITIRYDNLFKTSFPYSAGIHQAPFDENKYPEWHWHMVFYPPLLRSATIKKFMVGYEMLANPQRDISAEYSAERLRNLPDKHYKN